MYLRGKAKSGTMSKYDLVKYIYKLLYCIEGIPMSLLFYFSRNSFINQFSIHSRNKYWIEAIF